MFFNYRLRIVHTFRGCGFLLHTHVILCNATMLWIIWFCLSVVEICISEIIHFFLYFTLHFLFLGLFIHTHHFFLNLLNLLSCKGFIGKYDIISSVEHCFKFNSLHIIWSFIYYNCMLMCCVLLIELSIPFVSNKSPLVLYWYNVG